MTIIVNIESYYSHGVTNIGGEFMTIFLILSLVITLLLIDTKHWNILSTDTMYICLNPLLLTFVTIIISKMMITI